MLRVRIVIWQGRVFDQGNVFLSGRGHLLSVKDKLCPFPALENALRWSQSPRSTPCEMIIASKFSEQQRESRNICGYYKIFEMKM